MRNRECEFWIFNGELRMELISISHGNGVLEAIGRKKLRSAGPKFIKKVEISKYLTTACRGTKFER
jgi:hypothetical protein